MCRRSAMLHGRLDLVCYTTALTAQGWIFYAQIEFPESSGKLQNLRTVSELALTCLEYHVEDAMVLIAEVLENYPAFFEPKHQEMLWAAIAGPWGLEILKSSDAETIALARIIVAYAQLLLETKVIYKEPDNTHHQQVLCKPRHLITAPMHANLLIPWAAFLHDLLKYPEPVGIEDEVAPVVLDFWSGYISVIAEESFEFVSGQELPAWMHNAKAHVFQAVSELVQKIIYPASEVTSTWDSDAKKTFKVFRVDVRDILLEAFESLRDVLTDQFIDLTLRGLEKSSWLELEAGLFGIIAISETFTEKDDVRLARLFEQPLFSTISTNDRVPGITRRSAVETVAALDQFFLRNPRFLPQVLPFLLMALAQPATAHSAAKSFASLCSECRKSLTKELASFFQMYEQFLTYQTAEEFTKSMVLKGIAAIVQTMETEEKQLEGVRQIFKYITQDAMQAISFTKDGKNPEQGQIFALTTLKCLSSVGKALQATDEEVVDLESDATSSTFWLQGPGKEIQNQIINLINYLTQVFPANDEIIEAACNVLRSGFRESTSGPFVLPAATTVDFITKTTLQTPRLPFVLETACCWVSSNKLKPPVDFTMQSHRLLQHVLSIMHTLQHPRNDPEISVGCVELIQHFFNTNPGILSQVSPDHLAGMFNFTVESIDSPEVLPKRASAKLWKDVFELAGNTHNQHQSKAQDIIAHFGQAVTSALMTNICGEVDFTSLEFIIAPLRAMIKSDKNARTYISNSIEGQPLLHQFQQDPAVQDMVRKFIESLSR